VIVTKQISGAGRRRVDCPKCLSSDRDRLIWEYVKTLLTIEYTSIVTSDHSQSHPFDQNAIPQKNNKPKANLNNPLSILHVAPEIPLSKKIRALQKTNSITYHGIDLKTPGYYYPNWVQHEDLTNLPFANDHFDIIIASHVLEHIPNLQKALKEIHRTLKSNGQAILMFPVSTNQATDDFYQYIDFVDLAKAIPEPTYQEKINRFGQHDHIRLFGTDTIEILSNNNMFQVVRMNKERYTNILSPQVLSSLPTDEFIFVLKKFVNRQQID
jgi:SAM-dependent methyltransferase